MITTVIPVLNGEKWIAKAIESFIEQKGEKELLIIDGSENTKTEKVALPYLKKHGGDIRYHHRPDLKGIFDKCNLGLEIAKGDIFHTMACDHRLMPGTYELVEKEIGDNQWLFGNVILLNENEVEIFRNKYPLFSLLEYRKNNLLAGCASFAKTEFLHKQRLKFNQQYPFNGDYDFYLRLAHLAQLKQLESPLIRIVIRRDGLCDYGNNQEARDSHRAEIAHKIRKEFPLPEYLEPNDSRPKVLIAVCNQGWIRPEVVNMLLLMMTDRRVQLKITYPNRQPYENNLSHVAKKVRDEGWDYLIIIDDDNPPTRNPLDLCFLNLDIIGCPTPQWNDIDPFPIYWVSMDRVKDGWKMHAKMEGLQEVDAVGTGCMVIKRQVLEKIEAPFTRKWNQDGTMSVGVDFNFCDKAKAAGFKIYAHYDYVCDHFKELSLIQVLEFKNRK